jgi:hypothetical protein
MAITQAIASTFKSELLGGLQNFTASTGNTFKIALYTSSATLNSSTTAYTTSGECPSTGNYTAGGNTLTSQSITLSGTTAYIDFADSTWASSTISAAGALIYNSTNSNKAVCILDFGGTFTSTNGAFTVVFPAPTTTTAVLILN